MIFVEENLWAKRAQKLFGQVWGSSGKTLRTPENLPAPTPAVSNHCPKKSWYQQVVLCKFLC